ncbi:hypothetical protein MW887_007768 [Aspergillus wentii]|nr:hypothetical protein MW887_007768 [Aspergillus wentii]
MPETETGKLTARTYDEVTYLQGGGLVAIEMLPENDTAKQVDIAEAKVFFLMGGPGCGKSTIAVKPAADRGMIHLDPDVIVRRLKDSVPTEAWESIKSSMDEDGNLPDKVLILLIKQEIEQHLQYGALRFVIDGFPRSWEQHDLADKTFNFKLTLYPQVSSETLKQRSMQKSLASQSAEKGIDTFKRQREQYGAPSKVLIAYFDSKIVLHEHQIRAEGEIDMDYRSLIQAVNRKIAISEYELP